MKVLELEINNVRGIRHLSLKPNGNNFEIWGPNGSGKSAVVDALDFLLTGRISRLTGKGTGGITLSKHGPHIDYTQKLEEVTVRAIVKLPGVNDPIEIKRCMARPSVLECDEAMKSQLEPTISLALRGQHVLSRREILKYITAEAGTRAQEIQELLNISEIENIRKAFVKVQNDFERDLQAARRSVEGARGAVNSTVQASTFNSDNVLQVINRNRAVMGGQPLSSLSSAELKREIRLPTVLAGDKSVNVTLLERDIANLRNVTSEQTKAQISQADSQLRSLIVTIHSDPNLLRAFSRQQLVKLGMTLIDETGNCPLCDTPWPAGKLREYLAQRLSVAQVAAQYQERIARLSAAIVNPVSTTAASIDKVIAIAQLMQLQDDLAILNLWLEALQKLQSALSAPVDKYPDPRFDMDRVKQMLAPEGIVKSLDHIQAEAKARYPEASPEQTAWETLTRLEENLKALEKAEAEFRNAGLSYKRATALLESFQTSRDTVLGKLYNEIKDRFVELYRSVHGIDEGGFTAKIEPEGPSLNLEVDFYGRGTHPPHALHSEGHQDSMGLCLYLALAERLTKGVIDLLILDDVVMSVDADHRRQVCRLLATFFPDRQFLITTHDQTWAHQLQSEGVVKSQGMFEFYNWSIETGPRVNYEADIWERIEEDLQKNDVPSAAARLRRGAEQFFGMACDALQAPVIYKLNSRWELGDFLQSAMAQYNKMLKLAKKAADSWDDNESRESLQELDSTVGQIYSRTSAEQWAVNANVHYNKWANFSEQDFRPVVEAFQDLRGLFVCSKCGGMLHLTTKGLEPENVRCNCGKVNWNLIVQTKTSKSAKRASG